MGWVNVEGLELRVVVSGPPSPHGNRLIEVWAKMVDKIHWCLFDSLGRNETVSDASSLYIASGTHH